MKLQFRQLANHLNRELSSAYLIAGDEPLLVTQALDRIRAAAKQRGFEERALHIVERSFRWPELEAASDNLSLFAARRILELRLPSPRPGDAGARCIRSLLARPDPDRLLIVSVNGKLNSAAARSAWVKAMDQHGAVIDIWPIERSELPRWVAERARELHLELTTAAAELLADRVEGNLLAADQELIKLSLTMGQARIDETAILNAVANSARFDVFRLSDAMISGDASRALRVLHGLRLEGVQPALVSWALSREIILLTRLKYSSLHGENIDNALSRHGVWRRRQPAVKQAMQRLNWNRLRDLLALAADADSTIKGVKPGDPWDTLTTLVISTFDKQPPSSKRAA